MPSCGLLTLQSTPNTLATAKATVLVSFGTGFVDEILQCRWPRCPNIEATRPTSEQRQVPPADMLKRSPTDPTRVLDTRVVHPPAAPVQTWLVTVTKKHEAAQIPH
jgi:hypothetical protein